MYIVLELQTDGSTTSLLPTAFENKNEADNKYHTILATAAMSNLRIHSAAMIDEFGYLMKSDYYQHDEEIVEVEEDDEQNV